MNEALHSRFSPSSMPAELLEQTLVQRHGLARRLVQLFVESAEGQSKHHVLLIGPRGIGKSHLAALVYHRLMASEGIASKLAIAWLDEDEWGVASFLDLLVKILRALGSNTKDLLGVTGPAVEKRAEQLLSESLGGKTLLLIIENLDTVLRNLGDTGQKKLRALIQNTGQWSILATATALSEDIQRHASPFYGFFEIQNLEGLNDEDGITMLHRLAIAQEKTDLAKFLTTPGGRARVRALQHLAQGNHRVLIVFYDFLDEDTRGDLLTLLCKTIDALTPYYQSQMKELSPQQRKLVDFLCRHRVPATVKAIASQSFVSQQTAASQLKQLLEARYVRVERHGRESYYELSEPLLRICVEAKSHGGEPLPLLVELLRYWFSRKELESRLRGSCTGWDSDYFRAALHKYEEGDGHTHLSLLVRESCARLRKANAESDVAAKRSAAEELAEIAERDEDWVHYANALICIGDPARALIRVEEAVRVQPNDPAIHWALAKVYLASNRPQSALAAINRALELAPAEDMFWDLKGYALAKLRRYKDALSAYLEAKRLSPKDPDYPANAARMMFSLKRWPEAAKLLQGLVRRGIETPEVLANLGTSLKASGKEHEAVPVLERAAKLLPRDVRVWVNLAQCRLALGNRKAAATAAKRALELPIENPDVSRAVCLVLFRLNKENEATQILPNEAVAHGVFHELMDMIKGRVKADKLNKPLNELHGRVSGPAWAAAFRGGVWEYLGSIAENIAKNDPEELVEFANALGALEAKVPELTEARRFVDVMARYRTTGDAKVLLELPLEQRNLLVRTEGSSGDPPAPSRTEPKPRPKR
jgi:Flp pilus assembly protein TadD/DNA-binding transcriptional ArsR family regulator